MSTYSERIKELRTQLHWSQQDLADKLDLSKQTISQYERGVRKPDQDNLIALCDIFNVSTDYLLGKTDVTVRYLNSTQLRKLSSDSVRIPVLGRVGLGRDPFGSGQHRRILRSKDQRPFHGAADR